MKKKYIFIFIIAISSLLPFSSFSQDSDFLPTSNSNMPIMVVDNPRGNDIEGEHNPCTTAPLSKECKEFSENRVQQIKEGAQLVEEAIKASEVPNEYFENLYKAYLGGENGRGALYVVMVLLFMALVGKKLLDCSQVLIETLSGISAGIPDLVGGALTEATTKAIDWAKKGLGTIGKAGSLIKSNLDEKGSQTASKLDKFGDNADKAANATGNAVDKGAQVAGSAIGKTGSAAGQGMMKAGFGLSCTGIGAIVGVPLMVAGVAVAIGSKATEYGIKAAGKFSKYAIKATGKAAKYSAKAGAKTVRTAQEISNRMNTAKAASNKPKEKKRKYNRNR